MSETEILQNMVEAIWDEFGDSFESSFMFSSKHDFMETFRKKALDRIQSIEDKEEAIAEKQAELKAYGNCPVCGMQMVKRSGPYGDFLGCSGYPKCNHKGRVK